MSAENEILTLTFNPSLDLSTSVDVVTPTNKLRCAAATADPGGGGINVARVCSRSDVSVRAIIPVGGPNGEQLVSLLGAEGIPVSPVPIGGSTRLSMSVFERSTGQQYRFVLEGPVLTDVECEDVQGAVAGIIGESHSVVISGSMGNVPAGTMTALLKSIELGSVIVDTSGPPLVEAIRSGVMLVKPSAHELAAAVGRELVTETDIEAAACAAIHDTPTEALLVSIGAGGAILVRPGHPSLRFRAPAVKVRSAVGAGDSLVAGIVMALDRGEDLESAVGWGIASGTAAVLSDGTKLCEPEDVERLHPLVRSERVHG